MKGECTKAHVSVTDTAQTSCVLELGHHGVEEVAGHASTRWLAPRYETDGLQIKADEERGKEIGGGGDDCWLLFICTVLKH